MEPFLVVVTLPGTAERFTRACAASSVIGRSEDCAIHLAHPLVSRRHAEIEPAEQGRFVVRDLGSRNGTTVDGTLLRNTESVVAAGAVIQVGPYLLTLMPSETSDDTVALRTGDIGHRVAIDSGLHQVLVDQQPAITRLSDREFRLLRALEREQPGALTNQALGDATWGIGQWDTYMLHNLVSRIRRKFKDQGHEGDELIVTVPGVGYRLA